MTEQLLGEQRGAPSTTVPWPKLVTLDECSSGELVRIKLGENQTEWALKAHVPGAAEVLPIFVLPSAADPYCFDAFHSALLRERQPVLSYGRSYCFAADHSKRCELVSGSLFDAVGSLILSGSDRFIWGWFRNRSSKAFYNIDSGELRWNAPINDGAAFGDWTLWLNSSDGSAAVRVVKFSAKVRPPSQPANLDEYEEIA
jgi:hypothetical protein